MSKTESLSNASFQSSSPTTMGVANKMSSDERSQQSVVSIAKVKKGKAKQEQVSMLLCFKSFQN